MNKMNCWEVKKCGREPSGEKGDELGVCKAAISGQYNGVNNGEHQGRFCWAVAGNLCSEKEAGTYAKFIKCVSCDYFKQVQDEEVIDFIHKPIGIKGAE